jgi:formamidase
MQQLLTTRRTDGTQTVRLLLLNPSLALRSNVQKVPAAGTIKNGETVKIECVDWTGGQIKNNDSADDVRDVDLTKIHYLTGPFEIETAEPGDVLIVEIQDVQPLEDHPWGFTGIFDKKNGGEKIVRLSATMHFTDIDDRWIPGRDLPQAVRNIHPSSAHSSQ